MGEDRGPLVVFIGGDSCILGASMDMGRYTVLFLDTDIRTSDRVPECSFELVAEDVVKGEGAGGNLNLARVCFKKEMERIAPHILGRSLVVLVSTMEGATSVAGAVEINTLLMRVGLPSLVVLIGKNGPRDPSERALNLSGLLLKGPLRPGITVNLDTGDQIEGHNGKYMTVKGLEDSLKNLFRGIEEPSSIRVSPLAWNILREDGGPFLIGSWLIDKGRPSQDDPISKRYPSISILEVDRESTTSEINDFISKHLGDKEDIHMGILEGNPPEGKWRITSIFPSGENPTNMDEGRNQGRFSNMEDILASIEGHDFSPQRGL